MAIIELLWQNKRLRSLKTLNDRFRGHSPLKQFLKIDETAPEQYFKAAAQIKHDLPTHIEMETIPVKKLSFLAEDFYVQTEKHLKILILICKNF